MNHFRVGETLFLGTDVYHNTPFKKMHNDVIRLYAEIIELIEKPTTPSGEMGVNVEGDKYKYSNAEMSETSHRAIIDIGILDVDTAHLKLADKCLKIIGASSDMIVVDMGENKKQYKVGELLQFELDYMGALRTINSRYIEKKVIDTD